MFRYLFRPLLLAACLTVSVWSQSSPFDVITQDDGGVCQPQRQNSSFYETGCCGAPGRRFCAQVLHAGKGPFGASYGCTDPANNLVDNGKCDMRPVSPENVNVLASGRPSTGADVRFAVTSDLHFFRQSYNVSDQINHVAHINSYGATHSIAGVLIAGDMVTGKGDAKLGAFRLMWEKNTIPGSIRYAVYPGMGNHDASAKGNFGMDNDTGAALKMWSYIYSRTKFLHADRNASGCLVGIDPLCLDQAILGGSLNYSWDWHGIHFVQLHTWAGDTDRQYSPLLGFNGLEWLRRDLQHYVGDSGRPVVFVQHYSLHDAAQSDGWTSANKGAFKSIIAPYNVVAMFSGHSHALEYYSEANSVKGGTAPLENFVDGSGGDCSNYGDGGDPCRDATANFLGVRITDKFFEVGAYSWNRTTPTYGDTRMLNIAGYPYGMEPGACRKRISGSKFQLSSSQVQVRLDSANHTIYVKNISGQSFRGEIVVGAPGNGLSRWDYTETCVPNYSYLTITANGLAPNQEIGKVYSPRVPTLTAGQFSVYAYSPELVATPSTVTMSSNSASVALASLDSTVNTPFSVSSTEPWLQVQSDTSTTPATLSLNVVPTNAYPAGNIIVVPGDSRFQTIKIPFQMGNRPFNVTSNVAPTSISIAGQTVELPYNNVAVPGSRIDVGAPDQTPSPGTQYRFESWSDGGARNHRVTITLDPMNVAVRYGTWYKPVLAANPPNSGTVAFSTSSTDGFYKSGPQTLSVEPKPGYRFTGFTGQVSGTSTQIQLGGPWTITANFAPLAKITLLSNLPAGEPAVLAVGGTSYTFPTTLPLAPGIVSLAVPPSVLSTSSPRVRYLFEKWSDGNTTSLRNYTVGSADTTLTAMYSTEVLINVTANVPALGTVSGGGWFPPGRLITLQATPNAGSTFAGFTGDLTSAQNPATFTAGPRGANIVANFKAAPATLFAYQSGPASGANSARIMPIGLSNTGGTAAKAAQIDSIGSIVVVSGTGTVTLPSVPVLYGDIAAGGSAAQPIAFDWPDTAKRIRITVNISSDAGSRKWTSILNLIR